MKYQVKDKQFRTLGRAMEHAQKSQDETIFWNREDINNTDDEVTTEDGRLEAYTGSSFDGGEHFTSVAEIVRK
jgi:hypothetical protein